MRNKHPVYQLIGRKVTLRIDESSSYWRVSGELQCFTRETNPYPIVGIENDLATVKFNSKEVISIKEADNKIFIFLR